MSSQPPHQRARPGARHPFAASTPSAPLAQPQPVPSTPPPSYTPKDPFAPDDRVSSQYQTQGIPQPLTAVSTSSRPPSRRCSNPANAAIPAFSTPESHQQQATAQVQARRRSSAAARVAAASAPDLSRTLSREDPSLDMNGIPQSNNIEQLDSPSAEPPSSALHPRIAVVLGIKESFHVPLLLCRALATAPPIWWFVRCVVLVWRLAISALRGGLHKDVEWGVAGWRGGGVGGGAGFDNAATGPECGSEVASLVITEVGLAALWVSLSCVSLIIWSPVFLKHMWERKDVGRVEGLGLLVSGIGIGWLISGPTCSAQHQDIFLSISRIVSCPDGKHLFNFFFPHFSFSPFKKKKKAERQAVSGAQRELLAKGKTSIIGVEDGLKS